MFAPYRTLTSDLPSAARGDEAGPVQVVLVLLVLLVIVLIPGAGVT
jgi:hypothetical protein